MKLFQKIFGSADEIDRSIRAVSKATDASKLSAACRDEIDPSLRLLAFSAWAKVAPVDDAGLVERWQTCGADGGPLDVSVNGANFDPTSFYRAIDSIGTDTLRLAVACTDNAYLVDHTLAAAPPDFELIKIAARRVDAEATWLALRWARREDLQDLIRSAAETGELPGYEESGVYIHDSVRSWNEKGAISLHNLLRDCELAIALPAAEIRPLAIPVDRSEVPAQIVNSIRAVTEDMSNPLDSEGRPIRDLDGLGTTDALVIDSFRGNKVSAEDYTWARKKDREDPDLFGKLGMNAFHLINHLSDSWPECDDALQRWFYPDYEWENDYYEQATERARTSSGLLHECLDRDNPVVRRNALRALGQMFRKRIQYPSILLNSRIVRMREDPNPAVRVAAEEAITQILIANPDPAAIEAVLPALTDPLRVVRYLAASSLLAAMWNMPMGFYKEDIVAALKDSLADWCAGPFVCIALKRLGWQPATDSELAHEIGAERDRERLDAHWKLVESELLDDMRTRDLRKVENALYIVIGAGRDDSIAALIDVLHKSGDVVMAETYLNCGHPDLESAAHDWAARRGYNVRRSDRARPVRWGAM